eukprot:6184545-Pleurochrysis_carterae.AAC.1
MKSCTGAAHTAATGALGAISLMSAEETARDDGSGLTHVDFESARSKLKSDLEGSTDTADAGRTAPPASRAADS